MYFQILHRPNPQSGECERYCCLKESFRDAAGTTRNRTVLTTGFEMSELSYDELQLVAKGLNSLCETQKAKSQGFLPLGGEPVFPVNVNFYIQKYWCLIVQEKRLDVRIPRQSVEERLDEPQIQGAFRGGHAADTVVADKKARRQKIRQSGRARWQAQKPISVSITVLCH